MRAWLNIRLWIGGQVLLLLTLPSCSKSGPRPAPEVSSSEGMFVANAQPVRPIPRRLNPIIITNVPAPTRVPATNGIPPTPPTISCGPAQSLPCSSADGAQLTLTAHVEDVNGDALSVVWSADGRERYTEQVAPGGPPTTADVTFTYTFTPGEHAIRVSVSDGVLSSTCDTSVAIQKDNQDPVIVCPGDISVFADPGQCSAVVTFSAAASDNCPDVTVACDPPSGTAFPLGPTTVTCKATDAAGNSSGCAFLVAVQVANRCPQNDAYWRQNPGAWPVNSIILGTQVYSRSQLQPLIRSTINVDASLVLARQLIAASLNTGLHSDPRPVCGVLAQANALLSGFPGKLPYRVSVSSPLGRSMMQISSVLNGYNNGMLTANCVP